MPDWIVGLASDLTRPFQTVRSVWWLVTTLTGVGLVIAASFVRTMVPLRTLTVASNVLLMAAAFLAPEPAHIILYLVLIPVNTYRLLEVRKLTRRVQAASEQGDFTGLWLKPYMKARRLPAGATLFDQGDRADAIYMLVSGELDLLEIAKRQPRGEIFGEISFFSPERVRTLTASCATPCVVLEIGEEMFMQLYFQQRIGKSIRPRPHCAALFADSPASRPRCEGVSGSPSPRAEIAGMHGGAPPGRGPFCDGDTRLA